MLLDALLLLDWIGLASLFGLGAMGIDKLLAMGKFSRMKERTLWLVALLGGFPGIIVGGFLFRHKTSKVGFWLPVAVAGIIWAAILWYYSPLWGLRLP